MIDALIHLESKVWVLSPRVLSCLQVGGTSRVDQGVTFLVGGELREVCPGGQDNKMFGGGWTTVSNVTDRSYKIRLRNKH